MARNDPFNHRQVRILYGKRRARTNWFGSDANFIGIRFFLPRNLHKVLQAYRATKGVPIARLVAIAIYHEISKPDPFRFDMVATSEFEPGKYTTQASLIYKFLADNKGGMAKDLLVMARSLIGIPDSDSMLHAVRELLELDLIEEIVSLGGSDIPWVQIKNFVRDGDIYAINRVIKR